jgi:gas vesicle protein
MNDQNNQNNINAKDFIIGTFVGGMVGAAAALLLAPKSGKELRTDINGQAIVLKEKSSELATKAKGTSQTIAKTIQNQSSQVTNKVRDISDKLKPDQVEDSVYDQQDSLETEVEQNETVVEENEEIGTETRV